MLGKVTTPSNRNECMRIQLSCISSQRLQRLQ